MAGTLVINATVNGKLTPMPLKLSATMGTAASIPATFSLPLTMAGIAEGKYQINYLGGAAVGLIYTGITPGSAQSITTGGTTTWTINFKTATGSFRFNYKIDGTPAPSNFMINVAISQDNITWVPFNNIGSITTAATIPTGNYFVKFISLVTPSNLQLFSFKSTPYTITAGSITDVYFDFITSTGNLTIKIYVDGQPVAAPAIMLHTKYTDSISGNIISSASTPYNIPATGGTIAVPIGTYEIIYDGGM